MFMVIYRKEIMSWKMFKTENSQFQSPNHIGSQF